MSEFSPSLLHLRKHSWVSPTWHWNCLSLEELSMQIDKKSGFHSLCLYMNPVHTHTHTHTHTSLDIVFVSWVWVSLVLSLSWVWVSFSSCSIFSFLFWIVGVLWFSIGWDLLSKLYRLYRWNIKLIVFHCKLTGTSCWNHLGIADLGVFPLIQTEDWTLIGNRYFSGQHLPWSEQVPSLAIF